MDVVCLGLRLDLEFLVDYLYRFTPTPSARAEGRL
jgi:hypothetical protein